MRMEALEEQYKDSVTGGGNVHWLEEKYREHCWYKLNHYAIVTINIKKFRKYHFRYGKQATDEILKELYDIFADLLHDDEWIARVYSDNFVLLLHRKNKEELVQVIYDMDWNGFLCEDSRIHKVVYFSFGAYMINEPADDFYKALNKAELARTTCRDIKLYNTSYEFYDDTLSRRYLHICDMEEKVVSALKKEKFEAYLQPKIRLSDEKIVGAEVLLRWFDEDGRLIPLSEYLPILDHNGHIKFVDLFIFEKVCKKLEQCIKDGKPIVPLSFNISKAYYDCDYLLSNYLEVFEKYKVPKEYIQFELMESISFEDSARIIRLVTAFKHEGFACMLDDFGSGYASFSVLSNLRLDALKIDRQFFTKEFNDKDCAIVKTIVGIAKTMHMQTIAEGVEQKEYVDFLKEVGCDMIQGFYYYRPMPMDQFFELLSNQGPIDNNT